MTDSEMRRKLPSSAPKHSTASLRRKALQEGVILMSVNGSKYDSKVCSPSGHGAKMLRVFQTWVAEAQVLQRCCRY